ncbi:hypothetical protein [Oceanomicrobium pacificus]|uniref:Phosphomannomutase n=1 Tax=Oceanomicrobium pacificus TaxID=2692916 RepID=A0A6B0TVU4_9RHOB|nr:hypothetical protein [Oceanomicrobium pacificus]MXU65352.1 hypothetical protein [Oceanomicrobium pacificus]
MFTIEHEFDATVITLVDEGPAPLEDDVTINSFDNCVTINQHNSQTDRTHTVTLSLAQLRDLRAALELPEGTYRIRREK